MDKEPKGGGVGLLVFVVFGGIDSVCSGLEAGLPVFALPAGVALLLALGLRVLVVLVAAAAVLVLVAATAGRAAAILAGAAAATAAGLAGAGPAVVAAVRLLLVADCALVIALTGTGAGGDGRGRGGLAGSELAALLDPMGLGALSPAVAAAHGRVAERATGPAEVRSHPFTIQGGLAVRRGGGGAAEGVPVAITTARLEEGGPVTTRRGVYRRRLLSVQLSLTDAVLCEGTEAVVAGRGRVGHEGIAVVGTG